MQHSYSSPWNWFAVVLILACIDGQVYGAEPTRLRAGMIGLDTSHVNAFTDIINDPNATGDLAQLRVVAAYPGGTDFPSSRDRVDGFTTDLRDRGIEIVKTIPQLLEKVDVVMLESVDGRIHFEEASQVIVAGKPLFIDKPLAGSLADAIAIHELARRHEVPVWSASSIRFGKQLQSLLNIDEVGEIVGATTWGPCKYQEGTPDMFFYGIHGIEGLFTLMGTGCQTVVRTRTEGTDVLAGVWKDGRVGTYRGIRAGNSSFGATAFGSKRIHTVQCDSAYQELCSAVATFFQSKQPPVSLEETIEIFAFMEAADESKRLGGVPVTLASVLEKATNAAKSKLSAAK